MQRFDENGNFCNLPKPEILEEDETETNPFFRSNSNVVYDFTENPVSINQKK